MAPKLFIFLVFVLLLSFTSTTLMAQEEEFLVATTIPKKFQAMKEKLSHLQFYWHDILSGRNPTSVPVASGPTTNVSIATGFGLINMIDDPITVGPSMSSKLVGRAQGLYTFASQQTVGLMMAMNFVFTEGKYNGSTIIVLGRDEILVAEWEIPVIGGSGLFRFARGYVKLKTHAYDRKTKDAVVHYDCFVLHY